MKKTISYLFPFRLKNYLSKYNGKLEINLTNGKRILDTPSGNFSYGSLQKILHKGLVKAGFNKNTKRILVLGLGGGSVVQTIREDFGSDAFIQLVDIDSVMIYIALHEFKLNRFGNMDIVCADAADYLKNTAQYFDLIIVDIFLVNKIPPVFTQSYFIKSVCNHLSPEGKVIYNTFRGTMAANVFTRIKNEFITQGLRVTVMKKVDWTNDLIIAEKQKG